jgi:hypothetical protein
MECLTLAFQKLIAVPVNVNEIIQSINLVQIYVCTYLENKKMLPAEAVKAAHSYRKGKGGEFAEIFVFQFGEKAAES